MLLMASLIIGPLFAGSYYDHWRWPLIVTSSLAGLLLALGPRPRQWQGWCLLVLLLVPALQGLWMWYNAWGEFSHSVGGKGETPWWRIMPRDQQPFPEQPGSADQAEALDRLSYILPCLAVVWGTREVVRSRPQWVGRLAACIFWTGAAVALLGLIQRQTGAEGIFWNKELTTYGSSLFFGTYRSPGIATSFLNIALAMGLALLLRPTSRESTTTGIQRHFLPLLRTGGVLVILVGVITAGSKAGMVLGVLTLLLWAIMNRRAIGRKYHDASASFFGHRRLERNITLAVVLIIAVLSLLSYAGTMYQRWEGAQESGYPTIQPRLTVNTIQLEMMQDPTWGAAGFGPGSFYPLFPYFAVDHDITGRYVYSHNDYLQTFVEWGWLGGGLMACLIAAAVIFLCREIFLRKKRHGRSMTVMLRAYLIALTSILIHATVDFPMQIESIAITFAVLLGVGWAASDLGDEAGRRI